ncbi:hypothetical protein D8674_009239 [Pyrus ussuriensis x Pyrus communis]|uniref:Uncharacterized protein n=1 Tax=Pyrus ussuriensis x Pyrus communis TaxID=2448454 RepID=A0A5N5I236_9ROSA|nr:hypothetical protein D8674_009239 [Pyrus ussuriensis x Pyrus communis]
MMWLLGGGHQHQVSHLAGGSTGCSDAGGGDTLVGDCYLQVLFLMKKHFLRKGERKKRLVGPKPQ